MRGLVFLLSGLRSRCCALGMGCKSTPGDRSSRLEHSVALVNALLMARIRDPLRSLKDLLKDLKSEHLL